MTINKILLAMALGLSLTTITACTTEPQQVICDDVVKLKSDGQTSFIIFREGAFELRGGGSTMGVYTPKQGESCQIVARNLALE